MATANLPPGAMPVDADPFLTPSTNDSLRLRYSGFDNNAFSLYSNGSPSQAKRALEAHISETERRLQEASRLGQVLINQRKELADRLHEVEGQQQDEEINPALRTKLLDLEKEVNEVSRETARAFVGKNRVPSGDVSESTEYGGVAHPSPSKAHAASRKQRNQAPSRVNDLKLATDISHSLLQQVRDLQASLAEKDEALQLVSSEKSHLEAELESMHLRVKILDESEQRYKDENWSLETQVHELTTKHDEIRDREQRLAMTLSAATAQKASLEQKYEELKEKHTKLQDDHGTTRKQHEAELTDLKKNATADETQITGLHKKVEELTSQNKELAQAFAYRLGEQSRQVSAESAMSGEEVPRDDVTPENSPPGSPSKATPRHGALHSETTQSALNHAYRTIQNLKNQLHREKTERMEYKKLYLDAQAEAENRRSGIDSGKKRKGKDQEVFKKPSRPDRLGDARGSKEEILLDDEDWEDHDPADTPSKSRLAIVTEGPTGKRSRSADASTDSYVTATENSDAFETANEREGTVTDTDAFMTGAETLDGDSDLTETEAGPSRSGTRAAHRLSFQSTASTSADELDDGELKTPVQPQHPKYRIRVGRGGQRGQAERPSSEAPQSDVRDYQEYQDSPGSIASNRSTPVGQGQSLFAELENLSDGETEEGTPASSKMLSPIASPEVLRRSPAQSRLRESVSSEERPKPSMVDSGVMTEPWEPESKGVLANAAGAVGATVAGAAGFVLGRRTDNEADSREAEQQVESNARAETVPSHERDLARSSMISQDTEPDLSKFPEPPMHTSAVHAQETLPMESERTLPPALEKSTLLAEHTAPTEAPKVVNPTLTWSNLVTQHTEPVESVKPAAAVVEPPIRAIETPIVPLTMSSFIHQATEPVEVQRPKTATKVAEVTAVGAGAGLFGSLLGRGKGTNTTAIAEDETSQPPRVPSRGREIGTSTERIPFRQIDGNAPPSPERRVTKSAPKVVSIPTADESMQTTLTAEEIDNMLRHQPAMLGEAAPVRATAAPKFGSSSPRSRSRELSPAMERSPRRPGSSSSLRSRERTPPPPLPMEAKQVIAAAAAAGGKTSSSQSNAPPPAFGTMGPPTMPASAYRNSQQFRPRTPVNAALTPQQSPSVNRGVGTITSGRPGTAGRSNVGSPITRRSSVSSFASELDHRFNISSQGAGDMFDGQNSDPRMIQAITQTMIGEYLFKYTRKAGSENMSSTRHRRYFWVHPYTRTLYWSDQDPSSAGKQQLKAKSVQIEAVRIVSDDNPLPPGLHRKSLVVITPGRTLKFTAPTAQRHETWFNALSYLLLKTGVERDNAESIAAASDAEEFNPGSGYHRSSSRATGRSRISVSSYMSRATTARTVSPQRQNPTLRAPSAQGTRTLSNRLSAIAGSFSSRHSKQSLGPPAAVEEITHNPNDSAEELRKVIERQERDADRLENVRACCDGKHDVGSLAKGGRHSHSHHTHAHTHTPSTSKPATHNHGTSNGKERASATRAVDNKK